MTNWWNRRTTHEKLLLGLAGVAAAAGATALVIAAAPAEGIIIIAGPVLFASGKAAVELVKG